MTKPFLIGLIPSTKTIFENVDGQCVTIGNAQQGVSKCIHDWPAIGRQRNFGRLFSPDKAQHLFGGGFNEYRAIVVDADPIQRPMNAADVARLHIAINVDLHALRIFSEILRVGKRLVPIGVAPLCRLGVVFC